MNPSPVSLVVPHAVISAPVPEVDSVVVSEAPPVLVAVAARFMSQTFVPSFTPVMLSSAGFVDRSV